MSRGLGLMLNRYSTSSLGLRAGWDQHVYFHAGCTMEAGAAAHTAPSLTFSIPMHRTAPGGLFFQEPGEVQHDGRGPGRFEDMHLQSRRKQRRHPRPVSLTPHGLVHRVCTGGSSVSAPNWDTAYLIRPWEPNQVDVLDGRVPSVLCALLCT